MDAKIEERWGTALEALRQWAQQADGVVLTPTRVSVDASVREDFYGRVAAVQEALVGAVLGSRLKEAEHLAGAVDAVRREICEHSGLSRYALAPRLEQFIADSRAMAARPLQGLVLDAVAGAVPLAEVDGRARQAVRPTFDSLLRAAYEAWVFLGVVAELAPARFWAVVPEEDGGVRLVATDEVRAGWQVPLRELRMPEAVFETDDGVTYALKMECAREIDYYDALAPVARDTSAGGDTHEMIAHRVLLLYRLDGLAAAGPLVDRRKKVQVPCDLAVTVLAPEEMSTPSYLGAFIARARKLRTRRPLQVVAFGAEAAFPSAMAKDKDAPSVAVHAAALDRGALAPVATTVASNSTINLVSR